MTGMDEVRKKYDGPISFESEENLKGNAESPYIILLIVFGDPPFSYGTGYGIPL